MSINRSRILVTRRTMIRFAVLVVLAVYVANRIVGIALTSPEVITQGDGAQVGSALLANVLAVPFYLDKAALAASALTALGMGLYFVRTYDINGDELKRREYRGREYGGAHWASVEEMSRFANAENPGNNIILSERARLSLDRLPDRLYERNKHVMILGGSGSGKSFYFYKPLILQTLASYVFSDPKGELTEDSAQFLIDQGYDLLIINTDDPSKSMGFNPFTMIKTEVDILRLANCLIDNTQPPEGHKDFWVQAEQLLYEFCIGVMWRFAEPEARNIDTLLRLVSMAQVEEDNEHALSALDFFVKDEMEAIYSRDDDEYFLVELYRGFKKGAGKTLKSILVSCEVRLAPFKVPQVRRMMRNDEVGDMERLADPKRPAALFVIMSAGDNTYKFLTSMVFFRLFDDLVKKAKTCPGKRLPVDVVVGMDEFANIGKVPDMERHIAFLRSFGIDLMPALQSDPQLDEVYGENNAKVIRGNCDTTLFLGRCDAQTNEAFSGVLGETTAIAEKVTYSSGGSGGDSYSVNRDMIARKLMSASDLGDDNFPGDECIVKIKQAAPFRDKKYDTTTHPRYSELSGEPFDIEGYVQGLRLPAARERIAEREARAGRTMPTQDYYADVRAEVAIMGEA